MPLTRAIYGAIVCTLQRSSNAPHMRTKQHPKKPVIADWHPADVLAALSKSGWSFRQLALAHGYSGSSALARVMYRPYPRAESLVAAAIGIAPDQIWPSRYGADGKSNRQPGRRPARPAHLHGRAPVSAAASQK